MSFEIKKNVLHYYVDLLREKAWNETGGALRDVIRTMRMARHDKICGEDFSFLDFGNVSINEIYWSVDGDTPSKFESCVLHQESFCADDGHNPYYIFFTKDSKLLLSVDMRNFSVIVRDSQSMLSVFRFNLPKRFKYSIMISEKTISFIDGKRELIVIFDIKKNKCKKIFSYMDGGSKDYKETLRVLKEYKRNGKIKEICAYIWVDMINRSVNYSATLNENQQEEYSKDNMFVFEGKFCKIVLNEDGNYTFVGHEQVKKRGRLNDEKSYSTIIDACFSHDGKYCAVIFNSTLFSNLHNRIVLYQIENNEFSKKLETTHFELKSVDDCIFSGEDIIAYSTNEQCLIMWKGGKVCYSQKDIGYDPSIFNSNYSFNWFRNGIHFWDIPSHDNFYVSDEGITNNPSDIKIDISKVFACAISRNGDMLYFPIDPLNQTYDNIFRYTFESKKCVNIELPFNRKSYNQPLPHTNQRGLNTIVLSDDNNICAIGSMEGCIYLFDESLKILYDTLYMLPDIHLTGCSFNNITAPEMVKKIILQNNGVL